MIALLPDGLPITRDCLGDAPRDKGAYILLLDIAAPLGGRYGSRAFTLPAGRYAYCGSAHGPGGIAARLARHFRQDKTPHWHVDQLTLAAHRISAIAFPSASECALVERLERTGHHAPLAGFGSSDCRRCQAHLLAL